MRKSKLAALSLAFCAALGLAACAGTARAQHTARALFCTQKKIEAVQENRTQNKDDLIETISIDGVPLLKDQEAGNFYYSIPKGQETGKLAISWTGKDRVKLAILQNFEGKDLPSGQTVELIAYTKTEWQKIKLICTPLPIMSLETEENEEEIPKETSVPVQMILYDNHEKAGLYQVNAEGTIHVRGKGSSNYPKKGYRLTLTHSNGEENDMALLGLRTDGDWILYADYAETDKVRQVYTAKLWKEGCGQDNEFGVQTGNEYKFLELFLNGRYWGLYALGYPIDQKEWQLSEGEYSYFKENPMVTETELDYSQPGEVPGYELAGGKTEGKQTDEIWQPLKNYYATLFDTLWEDRAVLYTLADQNNAIDAWLFIDLIQGKDQMLSDERLYNLFITVKQSEEGNKVLYTPWDFDRTWGYVLGKDNANILELTPKDHVEMTLNPIDRLMAWEETDMIEAVQKHWKELRQTKWSNENVQALLDGYEQDIFASGVYERDYERWPDSGHNDGQTDLKEFRKYVADRFAEMDKYIDELGIK